MVINKGIHANIWISNANVANATVPFKAGNDDLSIGTKMFQDKPRKIVSTTIIYDNPIIVLVSASSLWLLFSDGFWTCDRIETKYLYAYKYLKL